MTRNKGRIGEFRAGKVGITEEDLANAKIRITMMVDEEVLDLFRQFARASSGKYQTLMNDCLKEKAGEFLKSKQKAIANLALKRA